MEEALPGALPRGFPGYPFADAKLLEELESLRKENLQYAEKLIKANSDSAALWEQVAQLKRILLENHIPFVSRLGIVTNARSYVPSNGSRRNSIEARSPELAATRRESNSPRRESSSSRESRLSVSSTTAEGVEKAEESPPRRRSHNPSSDGQHDSKPLPPLKPRFPESLLVSRAELATIGELTPNGSSHGGGSPSSKDTPPGRSKPQRASDGSPGIRGVFGGANDRGGNSGRFGRFPIRSSAKIHPLGGDEEFSSSSSRELVSVGGSRMPRGTVVSSGGSPSGGRMPGGAPTRAKLNFKQLWQTAGWAVVRGGKMKPANMKPLEDWGIVLDAVKEKQSHWSSLLARPIQRDGKFRRHWDILLLVCLMYIATFLPYLAAFSIPQDRHKAPHFYSINWVLDIIFTIDIVMNFRTTYTIARGKVVRDPAQIAMHYLKTWFIIDLISVIPLQMMLPGHVVHRHGLQILPLLFKILRLNKLFKVVRIVRLTSTFEALANHVSHGVLSILKFFCVMVGIGHLTACAFYFSAVMDDLSPESWPLKEGIVHQSNFSKYIISLYWAFSTLCTVGYGDVVPTTTFERCFAIVAMLLGATVFAYFMGNMSLLVANIDQEATRQEKQLESVNSFLRSRHIPKDLQTRVRDYYRYLWRHQVHSEENTIITGLNASLRTDIVLYMYREMLEKVPFFHGKPPQFISALVLCLRPEFFAPGDFIMREHDLGKDMYFIVEGLVHVLSARIGTIVKKPGEYFGEMALITGNRRSASCTAQTYCELYSLSKENLFRVLLDWPEICEEFRGQGMAQMQEAGLGPGEARAAAHAAAYEELTRKMLTEQGFTPDGRADDSLL